MHVSVAGIVESALQSPTSSYTGKTHDAHSTSRHRGSQASAVDVSECTRTFMYMCTTSSRRLVAKRERDGESERACARVAPVVYARKHFGNAVPLIRNSYWRVHNLAFQVCAQQKHSRDASEARSTPCSKCTPMPCRAYHRYPRVQ